MMVIVMDEEDRAENWSQDLLMKNAGHFRKLRENMDEEKHRELLIDYLGSREGMEGIQ